jgi:hypothetical protein
LKLSSAQVDQLNDILDSTRAKVRSVRDRYKPEMLQIKSDQVVQIRGMLASNQIAEYNKIVAEQEAKAKAQDARDRQLEKQRLLERQRRSAAPTAH